MSVSPKAIGFIAFSLVVAVFLALLARGLLEREPTTAKSGVTRVHKPAPDFAMPLPDGGQLALSEHRGEPIVINFWASWCPPCREEAPLLERAWRSYRDEDVLFVGVESRDTPEEGRAYLKEFDITYPNVVDVGGKITVDYGVIGLPVTFFVNREGIVQRRWVGAIDESKLETWVEEMLTGVAPSEADGANLESFFQFDQR